MSDHLIILAASNAPINRGHVDKHLVGYYTIQYMAEGEIELAYDDRCYHLEGAWFWTAYPGPRIRFHADPAGRGHWHHRHIGFTGPRVGRWMALGLLPADPWPAPVGHDWGGIMDAVRVAAQRPDPRGQLRAVNQLEQFLLDLAEARTQSVSAIEEPWLEAVRDRLTEEGLFAPDYQKIATDAGMSLTTLRRRFRQAMGMSMHDYALQSRLAAARQMLSETDLPLKAVAESLGYESVYFFSRQFRQQVGVPPGLYRRTRTA